MIGWLVGFTLQVRAEWLSWCYAEQPASTTVTALDRQFSIDIGLGSGTDLQRVCNW